MREGWARAFNAKDNAVTNYDEREKEFTHTKPASASRLMSGNASAAHTESSVDTVALAVRA